jgi:hypothetical protein
MDRKWAHVFGEKIMDRKWEPTAAAAECLAGVRVEDHGQEVRVFREME